MDLLIVNEKTPNEHFVILADNKLNKIIGGFQGLVKNVHVICDENYYTESSLKGVLKHPVKNINKNIIHETMLRLFYHIIFLIRLFKKAVDIVRRNPQIFFITNVSGHFTIGLVNLLAARLTGRRSLLRVTESSYVALFTYKNRGHISRLINRLVYGLCSLLEKLAFKGSNKIISVTPPEYYQKLKGFESKTVFIPDIIEKAPINIGKKLSEKKILFTGRLELEKSPFTFLKSLLQLSKSRNDFKSLIVGNGSLENTVRNFIDRNKLQEIVKIVPTMPHKEFIKVLKKAYILVNSSYLELMPNIILEAMACGIPVVASKTGGIPYIINEGYNGFLFNPGERRKLTDLINKLLDDETLRQRLSVNCTRRFKEIIERDFSASAVHDKYANIIKT
ncbi:MAG: glycosyltransferase [Candidatus Odinarchaeota archaeon]